MQTQGSELDAPPAFAIGTKVAAARLVRNDGTYPGLSNGTVLVRQGEVGYVKSVGSYLNRFYVYSIDFVELGMLVGMRRHELTCLEAPP